MHELSIASSIVETVLEFVETKQIKEVLEVRLAIGEMTCIQPEQLKFCYTAISRETPIENSKLEIERVETKINCPHCNYSGRPKYWEDAWPDLSIPTLQCPSCGQSVEAEQGHDCSIKTIRYVA